MAVKVVASVYDVLANDTGGINVYYTVSANGQTQSGNTVAESLSASLQTVVADVREAAKNYAVSNFGVTMEPGDTVLVFHPDRTVL